MFEFLRISRYFSFVMGIDIGRIKGGFVIKKEIKIPNNL